jgi:XTP/dITP diphosphohydrolase
MNKVLENLAEINNRKANKTVIALNIKESNIFYRNCSGEITLKKTGNQGFGYDPF